MSAAAIHITPVRTIRFYGQLGTKFGRVHRLAVESAAEAIRALTLQIHGLEAYLVNSKDRGVGYSVFYGKANLGKENLHFPAGRDEIRVAPMIMGAKRGGIFQIILGAVLIVASFFVPMAATLATAFLNLGLSLVLGGIVQLLTPQPKGMSAKDKPENTASYSFNGPINTQAQGNCVPVLYGELIIGSAVVSAGIDTIDHSYVPGGSSSGGSMPELLYQYFHDKGFDFGD